jgi:threonine dehydratase
MLAWLPHRDSNTAADHLKLENLQVAGGTKSRGVLNAVLSPLPHERASGLIAAADGNHGTAAANAGWPLNLPATVFLPQDGATEAQLGKIGRWGGSAIVQGSTWSEAYAAALSHAQHTDMTYVQLFGGASLNAGYGRLGVELLETLPGLELVVIPAAAAGAMIGGVAMALKLMKPSVRVVAVGRAEITRLSTSLQRGRPADIEGRPHLHDERSATQRCFDLV